MDDRLEDFGLRPLVNVSGTMTGLGASIAVPEVVRAAEAILPCFVDINDLQRKASAAIADATGAEAGCVTASCAAGITLAVAACMTGGDLAAIERLPVTTGLRDEVVLLAGHAVNFGAPVEQTVRLSGARVVLAGQVTSAQRYHLDGAITERTAALLFVVSHHTVQYGLPALETVLDVAHACGVPVIVDAASEYDLRRFVAAGADLVVYSGHKFLGGPTSGLVAGRRRLVRDLFLQNLGIGRGMKVGKEGIAGLIAALRAWGLRDHAAIRAREADILSSWQQALAPFAGVQTCSEPDPTGNPLDRLKISVQPAQARITAWDLADALAAGDPAVMVRDHELELGHFHLDPCNLHPGQAAIVARRLADELRRAAAHPHGIFTPFAARADRRIAALMRWPD
ncbi:aminotransferase class V-fold PLP-dependent enzyme [Gluconacetobacter tumulisoli]|uniref:Aminotransferase class V-fold PLP-dependent enzyme n=1 Tax=Gluconacetobacter tumulisoli TaxID=1286189 RepID=A0A7W4K6Z2_9PROT|nr:aminotransferase class V-fold PLP-dependent enzyme [Gluconacetobacter tumulisoli]MBB2201523.1 aminotransferase class V-fold PLP-dependent enzyme [Gluconacetobacter tumulisoli]